MICLQMSRDASAKAVVPKEIVDEISSSNSSNSTARRLQATSTVKITIKQRTAEEASLTLQDMDAPWQ